MKLTHLLAIAAVAACTGGTAAALTLTIEVTDARVAQGTVNAALYNSEATWRKVGEALQSQKAVVTGDKIVLVFSGLEPGRYAFSSYHDENDNGKLDTNVLGMPTERYGFTGDGALMGPPSFDNAAVELKADTTLRVTLR